MNKSRGQIFFSQLDLKSRPGPNDSLYKNPLGAYLVTKRVPLTRILPGGAGDLNLRGFLREEQAFCRTRRGRQRGNQSLLYQFGTWQRNGTGEKWMNAKSQKG